MKRKSKSKTIVGLIVIVAFLATMNFPYFPLMGNYKPNEPAQENQALQTAKKDPAPDFTVFDFKGNEVKLSDFAGKPVILDFWASWQPSCKSELQDFNAVYADVKDDVVFMMVDLVDGQKETQAIGQKFVEEQGYDFPVYFDNGQLAANSYGISSIPATFVIDSNGGIVTSYEGAIDKNTLEDAVNLVRESMKK